MKKWKLILGLISLVVIGGAGTVYYLAEVKTYETADESVDEVVESDYEIELPGLEEEESSADTETTTEADSENEETTSATEANGVTTASKTNNVQQTASNASVAKSVQNTNATSTKKEAAASSKEEKPTAQEIAAKYRATFENLEVQADGKIDALVSHAYNEYRTKKNNGEEISYFYFYQKYTTAGSVLERNTDNTFNYVYDALVEDLKAHGYGAGEAEVYKQTYDSMKEKRRSSLLNKAKEFI